MAWSLSKNMFHHFPSTGKLSFPKELAFGKNLDSDWHPVNIRPACPASRTNENRAGGWTTVQSLPIRKVSSCFPQLRGLLFSASKEVNAFTNLLLEPWLFLIWLEPRNKVQEPVSVHFSEEIRGFAWGPTPSASSWASGSAICTLRSRPLRPRTPHVHKRCIFVTWFWNPIYT